jgi:hypothetical protein
MSVTAAQALAKCAVTRTWAQDMCGQFCAAMYGFGSSGYNTALVQWNSIPGKDKHPGDVNAPAGMLLFWGIGQGHVAISDGVGGCWSIDISGPGTVTRVPASMITTKWGKPYLGWSTPYFQGIEWDGSVTVAGVDVSDFQAAAFPVTGLDFAFIKITEGTGYVNPKWEAQRATARASGLVRGFYHFGRSGDMHAQVDYFLSKISLDPGDILAFDWEDTGISSAQKDDWLRYAKSKAPGHKVVLYCNRDYWLNRDASSYAADGLWIADYVTAGSPRIAAPWVFHQWTDTPLDKNVGNFASRAALKTWAGTPEEDMPLTAAEIKSIADAAASAVWAKGFVSPTNNASHPAYVFLTYGDQHFDNLSKQVAAVAAQASANGSGVSTLTSKVDGSASKTEVVSDQAAALKITLDQLMAKAVELEVLLSAPGALIEKFTEALNALEINITTTPPGV